MTIPQKTSTRNAYMLLLASQIVNIGFGLLAIFITLLADEINLRPLEIGVIISIFMVARAISAAIIPDISDRVGRKIVVVISLIFYAASTALLGFARSFFWLFILRIVEGASAGAVFPTAEALLVDSVPKKDRGAWMGKYFTTFNFGFIIGPALGGVLFTFGESVMQLDTLSAFSIPFLFTGLLGFLSLLSVMFFVEDIITKDTVDKLITDEIGDIPSSITPHLNSFLFIGILSGFAIGLVIPIFTLHMTDAFLLNEGTIGFIFTISGSSALLVNYPAGKLSDKMDRMVIVVVGMILTGLAFIGVGLSLSISIAIIFFIFRSSAFQAYLPAYRAFQADKIPPMLRGKIMGRIQSAFNVGAVFGPLIGAAIYEFYVSDILQILEYSFYGGGVPFLVAGIFGLFQAFTAVYILRNERKKKASLN
ncbi:MAG: MFS transporter [Candidatus Heimdallarchaeota archaeon]|nr:MAG: MFS transporter [Candidatus Heimdallarchaeota archaeon]